MSNLRVTTDWAGRLLAYLLIGEVVLWTAPQLDDGLMGLHGAVGRHLDPLGVWVLLDQQKHGDW